MMRRAVEGGSHGGESPHRRRSFSRLSAIGEPWWPAGAFPPLLSWCLVPAGLPFEDSWDPLPLGPLLE
jgi:hypothetical protein